MSKRAVGVSYHDVAVHVPEAYNDTEPYLCTNERRAARRGAETRPPGHTRSPPTRAY